ncbi:MAG TPA: M20/M25/M40 family metallo-hydrolase [Fimbriimonas sp.]|nr:M20/M25/M40 family metallo-hydrolase [Fimbriimonas sp.]
MNFRWIAVSALGFGGLMSLASAQGDPATVQKIIDEGKNHSQVVDLLHQLCFDIGPRVTGSPKLFQAQQWAMGKFKRWGLKNVHLEKWGEVPVGFQRGDRQIGRMVEPFESNFSFTTMNWMPGTNGLERGPVIKEPKTMAEVTEDSGKLKGAWILCQGDTFMRGPTLNEPPDVRKALDDAGIAGRIFGTRSENVWSHGSYVGKTYDKHPTDVEVTVSRPDYDRLMRNLDFGRHVVVEFDLENEWFKGPIPQYNVVAEIPGTEKPDEVVIVSGHLDSWNSPGSQGANDNGTGSCVALETARILSACHAKPKRTIRFILWSGEEEGLLGSTAYVKAHEAELDKISAVLVDDEGSNYHSGFVAYEVMRPMMEEAFAPVNAAFPTMQLKFHSTGDMTHEGGSDHAPFDRVGVPGLDVGQSGKQNYGHVWHTQFDRFDEAIPEYLVQGATDFAVISYNLADAATMLPRGKPQR